MGIDELRKEIDSVDARLFELFEQRMEISRKIALWKKSEGRAVHDPAREEQKLREIAEKSAEMAEYSVRLWKLLMELSRDYQSEVV